MKIRDIRSVIFNLKLISVKKAQFLHSFTKILIENLDEN